MSEWMVVGVIVTLIGLVTSIVVPLIKLNTTLTRLSTVVEVLQNSQSASAAENTQAHERIWESVGENNDRLNRHETRITVLESK